MPAKNLYEQRLCHRNPSALILLIGYRLEPLARLYWESLTTATQLSIIRGWKTGSRTLKGIVAEMRDESDPR